MSPLRCGLILGSTRNGLLLQGHQRILQQGALGAVVDAKVCLEALRCSPADTAVLVHRVAAEQLGKLLAQPLKLEAGGSVVQAPVHEQQHLPVVPDARDVPPRAHEVYLQGCGLLGDAAPDAALESPDLQEIWDLRAPFALDEPDDHAECLAKQLRTAGGVCAGVKRVAWASELRAQGEKNAAYLLDDPGTQCVWEESHSRLCVLCGPLIGIQAGNAADQRLGQRQCCVDVVVRASSLLLDGLHCLLAQGMSKLQLLWRRRVEVERPRCGTPAQPPGPGPPVHRLLHRAISGEVPGEGRRQAHEHAAAELRPELANGLALVLERGLDAGLQRLAPGREVALPEARRGAQGAQEPEGLGLAQGREAPGRERQAGQGGVHEPRGEARVREAQRPDDHADALDGVGDQRAGGPLLQAADHGVRRGVVRLPRGEEERRGQDARAREVQGGHGVQLGRLRDGLHVLQEAVQEGVAEVRQRRGAHLQLAGLGRGGGRGGGVHGDGLEQSPRQPLREVADREVLRGHLYEEVREEDGGQERLHGIRGVDPRKRQVSRVDQEPRCRVCQEGRGQAQELQGGVVSDGHWIFQVLHALRQERVRLRPAIRAEE
mmetsp:Transcript_52906/g.153971  ORF Transcript_52906/g.153971 Transcript_52906/m.153971 type:complete len:603 (-) Transcript_52906:1117-2925(-)